MVGFFWVLLLIWGSAASSRLSQSMMNIKQQKQTLQAQNVWISNESDIDLRLNEIREKFDETSTLSKNELFALIERLAENMKPTLSTSQTQRGEIFNVHTVPVRFRDEPMESLKNFGEALAAQPYISLEKARILADKKDPRKLDAVFEITSFELKQ